MGRVYVLLFSAVLAAAFTFTAMFLVNPDVTEKNQKDLSGAHFGKDMAGKLSSLVGVPVRVAVGPEKSVQVGRISGILPGRGTVVDLEDGRKVILDEYNRFLNLPNYAVMMMWLAWNVSWYVWFMFWTVFLWAIFVPTFLYETFRDVWTNHGTRWAGAVARKIASWYARVTA